MIWKKKNREKHVIFAGGAVSSVFSRGQAGFFYQQRNAMLAPAQATGCRVKARRETSANLARQQKEVSGKRRGNVS
jgi:hypothetical protein